MILARASCVRVCGGGKVRGLPSTVREQRHAECVRCMYVSECCAPCFLVFCACLCVCVFS